MESSETLAWMNAGNCKNYPPGTMHPVDRAELSIAKKICFKCTIKQQCLKYALDNNEELGVWGGTSESERRRIQRHLSEIAQRSGDRVSPQPVIIPIPDVPNMEDALNLVHYIC